MLLKWLTYTKKLQLLIHMDLNSARGVNGWADNERHPTECQREAANVTLWPAHNAGRLQLPVVQAFGCLVVPAVISFLVVNSYLILGGAEYRGNSYLFRDIQSWAIALLKLIVCFGHIRASQLLHSCCWILQTHDRKSNNCKRISNLPRDKNSGMTKFSTWIFCPKGYSHDLSIQRVSSFFFNYRSECI